MSDTIRLTAAQAMLRYCLAQHVEVDGARVPYLAGCWAIFGHGNVAGLGEALHAVRDAFPTLRGHCEQSMAHTAIAYAKAMRRQRAMMVTTSIGPGATNLVTAAALAHPNRLPVLLVPGDVFANRRPDPVLQQIEDFADGTVSANDCFRPVSRYYDRIERPEQLLTALPRAFEVLLDPATCGPVTLAFCQDVQAEAYDYPEAFFAPRLRRARRIAPDARELRDAAAVLHGARRPLLVAGGGVHYSDATDTLAAFATQHNVPVVETQAGKSALPGDHPTLHGPIGVTGGTAANDLARKADVVLAVGTRLQDFTTGSWGLFQDPNATLIGLNVQPVDATKRGAIPLVADARVGLAALSEALGDWTGSNSEGDLKGEWASAVAAVTAPPGGDSNALPTDMQVVGAVQRAATERTVVMGAAGTMPGEMHKLWSSTAVGGYHFEYGYSCMGYEIAGALGIKLARPDAEVVAMVGDGSYLMLNSELNTAAAMGVGFTVVVTDNRGYGCINRLQAATGGAPFNNLFANCFEGAADALPGVSPRDVPIDYAAHAASLGAEAVHVGSIAELEAALREPATDRPKVIVIDTDPGPSTEAGGALWEVGVPEVSERDSVREARATFERDRERQRGAFAPPTTEPAE